MSKRLLILLIALPLLACQVPAVPPQDPLSAAESQARLATDPQQARLWQEAARSDVAPGIHDVRVRGPEPAVRPPPMPQIADRPAEQARVAFPPAVQSALAVLAVPEIDESFSGAARVASVDGEFVTLDLGDNRLLRLQAKVRNGPLRARPGETVQLFLRQGDVFERNDVVAVKFEEDDLIYALVGGDSPVRLDVPSHGLAAVQTGEPEQNSMNVSITVGNETHELKPGEQAIFQRAGLTVKVLASVAVQGEAVNVLEGEPYRLELLGWRTGAQPQ